MKKVSAVIVCLVAISSAVSCTRPLRLSSLVSSEEKCCEAPVVCLKSGCVKGKYMEGFQIGEFEAFMGIPFAKPPVGDLRFKNPQPVAPWTGILNATTEKSWCTQKNDLVPNSIVMGSEDCLYLYVYRPKNHSKNNKAKLAVMVYIHGGGYFSGTADPRVVGAEYFMDTNEVILVVIQYRLGALGFLSTGDKNAPGNFGLKDQSLAIKWTYDNIREFGGDRKKITIFGQSAGAASVHMHMMSPLTQGYFSKAIVMSGSALAGYNIPTRNPINLARKQAEVVGIRGASNITTEQLVDELRKIEAEKIIGSSGALKYWSVDPLTLYRPVIENDTSAESFLSEDPRTIWREGKFKAVPWMTGYVQHEGAVRAIAITSDEKLLKDLNSKFDTIMPLLMEIANNAGDDDDDKVEEKWWKIKQKYFDGSSELNKNNVHMFLKLYSDYAFIYPMNKGIKQFVSNVDIKKNPVSLYKFQYKGPLSYSLFYTGGKFDDYGVVHCDDLIYLFRSPLLFSGYLDTFFSKNSTHTKMAAHLVKFYVDFAYKGIAPPLKPYRKCEVSNKISSATDCDFIEFTNSKDGEGMEVNIINEIDENTISFWRQFDSL